MLVLPAELPFHLAKMDTGNGVWLIAVANVMETESGQNLLAGTRPEDRGLHKLRVRS